MKTKKMVKIVSALLLATSTGLNMQSIMAKTISFDQKKMIEHLTILEKITTHTGGNRAMGTEGAITTAGYIDDVIEGQNTTLVGLPFETKAGSEGQNVLVTVPGKRYKDIIMLGAHYDSAKDSAGMNDNASGIAVLLSLIQYYSKPANTPKNTLFFVFWDGNKSGLAGSKALAKEFPSPELGTMHAYINLDEVGVKNPSVVIASPSAKSQHKNDIKLEKTLTDFFKSKNKAVKNDATTISQTDAFPFVGKMPVISYSFKNDAAQSCQSKSCDTVRQIDPQSLQLAAEAAHYIIDALSR